MHGKDVTATSKSNTSNKGGEEKQDDSKTANDDDEFRFNDASTHEGHLRQNGELTWFCSETIIMMS